MEEETTTVAIQDKCLRIKQLLYCLGYSVENSDIHDHYDKPYWDLIFEVQEKLESIVNDLKKI